MKNLKKVEMVYNWNHGFYFFWAIVLRLNLFILIEIFQVFQRYLTFCGIGIQNAQLFDMSVREYKRNQVSISSYRFPQYIYNIYNIFTTYTIYLQHIWYIYNIYNKFTTYTIYLQHLQYIYMIYKTLTTYTRHLQD